jgi:hypothetical protein
VAADRTIFVSQEHIGLKSFVGDDGVDNLFDHASLNFNFNYVHPWDPAKQDMDTDGNMFDYALYGPFTVWNIALEHDQSPYLDLKGMTGARLEFTGWSRATPASSTGDGG